MGKSKLTKFQKWWENKGYFIWRESNHDTLEAASASWNAAVKHALKLIKSTNRAAEGYSWQHEDIDILIEDLEELIEK